MKEKNKNLLGIVAITLVLMAAVVFLRAELVWGVLILVLAGVVLWKKPEWGLYAMAALYPAIYWQIFIGKSLNVPYVDAVALILFVVWAVKILIDYGRGKKVLSFKNFPGLGLFVLFFIVGGLSILNVADWAMSLKYLLRPITFFYLMFVVLPVNLIKEKKVLKNILWIMYGVGIAAAISGMFSLIFPVSTGWRRAIPFDFWGLNPLGDNHNVLAEVLVGIIPIGWLMAISDKKGLRKRWLWLGLILMILADLLTFSRTGWLALLLEAAILTATYYRKYWKKVLAVAIGAAILLLPVWILMGKFLTSEIVQSSNENRLRLTEIAWQNFEEYPLVGAGVGTFMTKVAADEWYILDFGVPLEAHGVIQKLIAETGILGLMTFFGFLGYCLWYIGRVYNKLPKESNWRVVILSLGVAAVGCAFFQLFNTSYFIAKMWWPIGVAMAASGLAALEAKKK